MSYTSEFPIINVTVDAVAYRVFDDRPAEFLFITRGKAPYKGSHALPGGFLNPDESAEQAVLRELAEETGITGTVEKFLSPRTAPGRDPRGPVVSLPFIVAVDDEQEPVADDDAASARWVPITELIDNDFEWAFDHEKIFTEALKHFYFTVLFPDHQVTEEPALEGTVLNG